jgi:putative NADPH-quinone reductase/1,4-dihydroxy-2-naphthoate octaprenyltransferase
MRVLVTMGHPRTASLTGALAEAFVDGARAAHVEVRLVRVGDLAFEPDVLLPSPEDQALEPDLAEYQAHLIWADHLVFVYPTWWGAFPARMKALLDRTITPGFGFRYQHDGTHRPLLGGRTAELITTMDTPGWVYRWIYGAPGHHALEKATLGFCGVRTVRKTMFGPVIDSSTAQRGAWLERARALGERLQDGPVTPLQRAIGRLRDWLAALRLQFYPMSWIAYSVGALAAPGALDQPIYWLGLFALFLLEAATVFSNDWFDQETDRRNAHYGPFNGGSRVLVDGRVEGPALRAAALGTFAAFGLLALGLAVTGGAQVTTWLLLLAVLAIGYTAPPLQLSYRTLGELDVAFTHSAGVLLTGYLLQQGDLSDPLPWLVSLPLMLSIMPAIALSGIPDMAADSAACKRTLAVQFGARRAVEIAIAATAAAVLTGIVGWLSGWASGLFGGAILLAALHGVWLVDALLRYRRKMPRPGRIDALMLKALTFILWFCVLPLVHLL